MAARAARASIHIKPRPPDIIAKVRPNPKTTNLVAQTGAVVKQARIEPLTLVDHM
jgi:hypothetical protein